ncbi:MAG: hypothetical protein JEY97_03660 [Bacteroidales bacterium]|nr:hypothetical protein [Bacteroidales bacterium]
MIEKKKEILFYTDIMCAVILRTIHSVLFTMHAILSGVDTVLPIISVKFVSIYISTQKESKLITHHVLK